VSERPEALGAPHAFPFRVRPLRAPFRVPQPVGGVILAALAAAGLGTGFLVASQELDGTQLVAAIVGVSLLGVAAVTGRFERVLLGLLVLSLPFNIDLTAGATSLVERHSAAALQPVGITPLFLILGCLYPLWLLRLIAEPSRLSTIWAPGMTPLLCLLGWSALSMVNAHEPSATIRGLVAMAKGMACYLYLANHVKTRADLRLVASCLTVGLLIEGLIACAQAVTGSSLGLEVFGERQEEDLVTISLGYSEILRVGGTIGHPNGLGRYLAVVLPVAYLLTTLQALRVRWPMRALAFMATVAGAIALVFTLSRAAWISAIVALAVMVTWLLSQRQLHRGAARAVVALSVIGVIMACFAPLIMSRWLQSNVGAIASRFLLVRVAFAMIASHPILGIGLYHYKLVMHLYDPTLEGIAYDVHQYQVHNVFLLLAAEIGLVGLACFAWFLWVVIRRGWDRVREGVTTPEEVLRVTKEDRF